MILYEHPFSPYAQKIKIALREKAIAFDAVVPEGMGSGVAPELSPLNPRVEVPALADGAVTVFDSTIILEYLEDKYPEPALLPDGPAARARARMIEDVCDTQYEAINWGLIELRYFKRGGSLRADIDARAVEQTAHLFTWLEGAIGDRPWFGGDRFGWADLSVVPHVMGSTIFGIHPPRDSALARWWQRAMQRPSVAKTREEALGAVTFMENVGDYFAKLKAKRHYRDHRLEWVVRSGGLQMLLDGIENDNVRFTDTALFAVHQALPAED